MPTATDVVAVSVPNRFKLDWIRTQYAGRIESVLTELAGTPVRLELTLAPRAEPAPRRGASGPARGGTMASAAAIAAAALDRAAGSGTGRAAPGAGAARAPAPAIARRTA